MWRHAAYGRAPRLVDQSGPRIDPGPAAPASLDVGVAALNWTQVGGSLDRILHRNHEIGPADPRTCRARRPQGGLG